MTVTSSLLSTTTSTTIAISRTLSRVVRFPNRHNTNHLRKLSSLVDLGSSQAQLALASGRTNVARQPPSPSVLSTENDAVSASTTNGSSAETLNLGNEAESGLPRPFLLYTAGTPNGRKTSIYLEELKPWYWIDYTAHKIDISKNTQKEDWFLSLNPNGRIPVLVDHAMGNFAVFETAAILLHLAQRYDRGFKFWFDPIQDSKEYSTMLQWMFWAHGGLGPMQGQSNHFQRFAPVDIPYAKKRYLDETERLFGVLQLRLQERDYLAGPGRGRYTLADINAFPWVAGHAFAGVESLERWPGLNRWFRRISGREQVQKGLKVPS